jgi:hypothetical protein
VIWTFDGMPARPYGYVRLFNRTGEAWHIVQCEPTPDAGGTLVTLCGYLYRHRIVASRADDMKVCSRCERVRARQEAGHA